MLPRKISGKKKETISCILGFFSANFLLCLFDICHFYMLFTFSTLIIIIIGTALYCLSQLYWCSMPHQLKVFVRRMPHLPYQCLRPWYYTGAVSTLRYIVMFIINCRFMVGSLCGGYMFDRFNREGLLAISQFGMAVSQGFTPYCNTLTTLLAARFFVGIFCGAVDTGKVTHALQSLKNIKNI